MPRARGKDADRTKKGGGTQHEVVREGQVQHQRGKLPTQPEMQDDPQAQRRTGQRATVSASPTKPTRKT